MSIVQGYKDSNKLYCIVLYCIGEWQFNKSCIRCAYCVEIYFINVWQGPVGRQLTLCWSPMMFHAYIYIYIYIFVTYSRCSYHIVFVCVCKSIFHKYHNDSRSLYIYTFYITILTQRPKSVLRSDILRCNRCFDILRCNRCFDILRCNICSDILRCNICSDIVRYGTRSWRRWRRKLPMDVRGSTARP